MQFEWSPRVGELAALAPYLHIYNINKPMGIQILRELRDAGRERYARSVPKGRGQRQAWLEKGEEVDIDRGAERR